MVIVKRSADFMILLLEQAEVHRQKSAGKRVWKSVG
jgi:hypothetical protein